MEKQDRFLLVIYLCSIVFLALFHYYSVKSAETVISNIVAYAICCAAFVGAYFLGMMVLPVKKLDKKILNIIGCVYGLSLVVFAICMYYKETSLFAYDQEMTYRHRFPWWIYFLIITLFTVCIDSAIMMTIRIKFEKSKRLFFALFVALLQGCFTFSPNIFGIGARHTTYHLHAYVNSIINVLYKCPYDNYNTSIYGHYGIFFYIPVKILHKLGVSYLTSIELCIAGISALSFIIFYYLVDRLVKNDSIFYLCVVANVILTVQIYRGQYYQVLPHRLFFPMLLLLVIYNELKTEKMLVSGWLVCSLAVVWNIEIGAVCLLAYCIFRIFVSVINKRFKLIVIDILLSVVSFVVAYCIGILYNIWCSGAGLSIKAFIFPIGSSNVYSINDLKTILPTSLSAACMEIILFLSIICYCLKCYIDKELTKKKIFLFGNSVLALGVFVYYINRAAYCNIAITHFNFILLIAVLCDVFARKCADNKKDNLLHSVIYYYALILLVAMSISSVVWFGEIFSEKISLDWNTKDVNILVKDIKKSVPADVVAFGMGVPELYAKIGRDTHVHMVDWSDMNMENQDYINNIVIGEDEVFAEASAFEAVKGNGDWECVKSFHTNGTIYGYYRRVGN